MKNCTKCFLTTTEHIKKVRLRMEVPGYHLPGRNGGSVCGGGSGSTRSGGGEAMVTAGSITINLLSENMMMLLIRMTTPAMSSVAALPWRGSLLIPKSGSILRASIRSFSCCMSSCSDSIRLRHCLLWRREAIKA